MKEINVGIIGLGVGEQHLIGFIKNPNCKVELICDFDQKKLNEVSAKYPYIKTTLNPDDVLNDPLLNLVSIASYDNFHCDQILKAFKNNKHVFVEKPLCQNQEELNLIIDAIKQNPHLQLSSNLILRKVPRFIDLKKNLNNGILGKPYLFQTSYDYGRLHKITNGWRGQIPFYSVMHGGGIHLIDLIMWLSSNKIISVNAIGTNIITSNSQFKFYDCVISNLKLSDNSIASVTANFPSVTPHGHRVSVFAEKGTFHHGPHGCSYFKSRNPEMEPNFVTDPYPGVNKDALLNEFIQFIVDPSSNLSIKAQDVIDSMAVSIAVEKSLNLGREVSVVYHNIS